jgi:pimeloyl-ACP methyl ester carboxylesterase
MIWGTREKRFAALAEYVRGHMPHLETVALEAGHGMNMEAADAFNEAVIAFINHHHEPVSAMDANRDE